METVKQTFTLKSIELGGQLENRHFASGMGFTGKNQSPQLYWENPPEGTKSFGITMYDLDAPTGSGFWHWIVFNIPSNVQEILSDAGNTKKKLLPDGAVQSNTDMGFSGYAGAAPPEGPAHRYLITVHALARILELNENATPAFVGFNMHFATLAKASLLVYGKNNN